MRSLMLILVCALSVSARCVKKQTTNDQTPVVQKAATKQTAQTGQGRKLLEESSAGSGGSTDTVQTSANQGDQSSEQPKDQQGSSSSTSSGSGDTSSSGGSSTTSNGGPTDNSNKDTSNTNDASATTTDGSNTDASNTEDDTPSSTPSGGTGDTSSNEGTSSTTTGGNTNNDSANNSTTTGAGYSNQTSSTGTSSSTSSGGGFSSGGGSGSCGSMKSVCFNSGMQPSMFDQMKSASSWITFGLTIPGGTPSERAKQAHIPMMAFENHVKDAIDLVNGPDAPEWMLTFNEPDHSYMEQTPKMDGKTAAEKIAPLLAKPGSKTKFVAPGPAFWTGPFLEEFFAACNCKDFFSAYNMHSYTSEAEKVIDDIKNYRKKWNDKPLWITELAPGGCGKSPEKVGKFFKDVFKFSKDSGFVDKVMWNTGNQIDAKDSNVCDTWLVDGSGKPGPLLEIFESMDCS